MQRSAFIPALRRPLPRSFRYLRAAQFWVLALVAAAVLLVLALQWRATANAEVQAQISTEKPVAARPPQPEHVSGASTRPDAGRKSLGPLGPQAPLTAVTAAYGEPASQKHQFALLRHHAHGRSAHGAPSRNRERRVARRRRGRPSRGMTVAVVQADRVLLRSGGYAEELQLQMDSAAQAPLVAPVPTSTFDVAADVSRSERAPIVSPTPADVRDLVEQGMAVPNPD